MPQPQRKPEDVDEFAATLEHHKSQDGLRSAIEAAMFPDTTNDSAKGGDR